MSYNIGDKIRLDSTYDSSPINDNDDKFRIEPEDIGEVIGLKQFTRIETESYIVEFQQGKSFVYEGFMILIEKAHANFEDSDLEESYLKWKRFFK